jgi:Na+-transporting NADH:ubiquinone oxidoreductase subunit NqrC
MDEDDEEGMGEHTRITNLANTTRILSVVLLIAMIIGVIVATAQVIDAQSKSPVNEYYQRVLDAADED